ncbi:heavy-metal-associated domain-containing protein [Flavobacterium hiemivividum]|uniref:Heavy-metal-associated domain-containing protein n=1 Tax=Flavobacterium hiemivividum TaxID=2541734 RepID=A0A4R5D7L2_9FLAO|nr:heavy metal-associated domain-containing protein [Flavobacterium hiemivividum]TDE06455.1 heavy-metal-associated domain-containing protein [Flavobacterium hiemivividum]
MNITKSLAVIALAGLSFVSCKKNTEEAPKETAQTETEAPKVKKEIAAENLQTANFSVAGMTCAVGCAKTIQEDLTNLEGVQNATVDFETKSATVTFDKTVQNPESLTKVVLASGDGKTYTVSDMKS